MSTYHEAVTQEQAEWKDTLSRYHTRFQKMQALAPQAKLADLRWLARNCGGDATFEALLRVLAAK